MERQDENLREAARLAQETMDKCDAFIGESSDDGCRAIYSSIKEMMAQHKSRLQQELAQHAAER
ncbi:MAG: hypothetical protein M1401_01315 [Chloroflexi bacterium]|nr:hypothetical protein [Chloroflexota bacterium]